MDLFYVSLEFIGPGMFTKFGIVSIAEYHTLIDASAADWMLYLGLTVLMNVLVKLLPLVQISTPLCFSKLVIIHDHTEKTKENEIRWKLGCL